VTTSPLEEIPLLTQYKAEQKNDALARWVLEQYEHAKSSRGQYERQWY